MNKLHERDRMNNRKFEMKQPIIIRICLANHF